MARTITIAGGHGQIALRLGRLLVARGDRVRGLIRKPDQADDLRAIGVEPLLFDLENDAVGALANEVAGSDAVVFAAGAGPGSGDARKESMDRDGAVKLIEAATARGIARYLIVSSIGADSSAQGNGFAAYLRAKGEADDAVRASDLDWTVVCPGALTDDPGSGRVAVGATLPRGAIPRDDVAAVVAASLDHSETIHRTFVLVGGSTPIDEALAGLAAA